MPAGSLRFSAGDECNASVSSRTDANGTQVVEVFVVGDTPWTSLPGYRVTDNKITPLRYAMSESWILAGILVCLVLLSFLLKPLKRVDEYLAGKAVHHRIMVDIVLILVVIHFSRQ